jgi:hypothetical protein
MSTNETTTDDQPGLTADRVEEVMRDCLFRDDEPIEPRVEVAGIVERYGFHPERLEAHRSDVEDLLSELPVEFFDVAEGGGGGWSFLNACMDRNGTQWTGLHRTMGHLFALGEALGVVTCQLPRELWAVLPGGMPYYVIKLKREGVSGGGEH